ncbi:MAG: ABC transporter permease, partial [Candidatus Sumerlaeota bacterium]|nr:ABC transporter permease [Candidatus Sumerlaeota bacterium]
MPRMEPANSKANDSASNAADDAQASLSPGRQAWRRLRRNRMALAGGAIVLAMALAAAVGPWMWPFDYAAQNFAEQRQPPSRRHPCGTDFHGRDLCVR